MRKPRVFIASSVESLDVADAINVNLDHQAEVTVWKNGFKLSTSSIDSLLEKAEAVDFAIFIFTPDDLVIIRNQDKYVVRDNVLFELGLFIGILGKQRCFIVKPRGVDLHFPTDLLGLTPADYDGQRSDGDLASAVNYSCILIKKEIAELGPISQELDIQKKKRKKFGYTYKVSDIEHILLLKVLEKCAGAPYAVTVWDVYREIDNVDNGFLELISIKLERLGYLERSIEIDRDSIDSGVNCNYYAFNITTDGIDYLLENELLIDNIKSKNPNKSQYDF